MFWIKFCCHHLHSHQIYPYFNFCRINTFCGTFFVDIKFDVTINQMTANMFNCCKCYCWVSSTHFVQFWLLHLLFHFRSCCWCLQIWSCYCIQVRGTCIICSYFFLSYKISGPPERTTHTEYTYGVQKTPRRLLTVFYMFSLLSVSWSTLVMSFNEKVNVVTSFVLLSVKV